MCFFWLGKTQTQTHLSGAVAGDSSGSGGASRKGKDKEVVIDPEDDIEESETPPAKNTGKLRFRLSEILYRA